VFFYFGERRRLHDIQGLGEKRADKRQYQDANTTYNGIETEKRDHGNEKKKPV
jgi:hypothetical protein